MPDLNNQNIQEPKPTLAPVNEMPTQNVVPTPKTESETPTSEAIQQAPVVNKAPETLKDEDGENIPLTREQGQGLKSATPVEPLSPVQPIQTPVTEPVKSAQQPVQENVTPAPASTPVETQAPTTQKKPGFWARLFGGGEKKPKTPIETHVDSAKKDSTEGAAALEAEVAKTSEGSNPVTPPAEQVAPIEQGQQKQQ